jgi:molecular chaperone GrpE (heat shock protein)
LTLSKRQNEEEEREQKMTNEDLSPDRKFIISLYARCTRHVENLNKKLIHSNDRAADRAAISMITAYMGVIMSIEAYLKKGEEILND